MKPPRTLSPFPRSLLRAASAIALALTLGACSEQAATLPATQVAAKVGSEEISMHQINAVLAQGNYPGASAEQTQARSRAVLENLIDRQLAVDQAMQGKLHRDPDVMAQIEAAKREVLATAYVKQFAARLSPPAEEETRAYFEAHPELFAQRRIYRLQEIVTANSPEVLRQLNTMASVHAPLEEVALWLKTNNIAFAPATTSRAAEQIPMEHLARMHALKDGQDAVFTTPSSITLLRLQGSQTAPIALAAALPRIALYLNNQRAGEAITAHMKDLRSNIEVQYMGEFTQPVALAHPLEKLPTAATLAEPLATSTPPILSMEKGVAGLK